MNKYPLTAPPLPHLPPYHTYHTYQKTKKQPLSHDKELLFLMEVNGSYEGVIGSYRELSGVN